MGDAYIVRRGGGGSPTKSIIIVKDLPTGSTVTATKGEIVKTSTEKNGEWWFKNLDLGEWTLKATLADQSATTKFNIEQFGVYYISMAYRLTPEFTYTGDYEIVDDSDEPIEDFAGWKANWKIRFLTSGELTITNMYGWNGYIDAFLVGGGGPSGGNNSGTGGGAGGYTHTEKRIKIALLEKYNISIGSGSSGMNSDGGTTMAFSKTAAGGKHIGDNWTNGGNGGCGGAGPRGGNGGSDGGNGTSGGSNSTGGKGQGTTTREFGELSGKLYAGGGGSSNGGLPGEGGGGASQQKGEDNTGGGGGGAPSGDYKIYAGGSGIVIIRNAREVE